MSFEVFTGKGRAVQGRTPTIAVQAQGRIALNQAAYELMGRPTHVELLYDAEFRRIGLRSVPEGKAHAYRITQPEEGRRWVVVAVAFSRHYGIKGSRKDVYDAALEEDGVLAATMKDPPSGREETAPSPPSAEEGGGSQEGS